MEGDEAEIVTRGRHGVGQGDIYQAEEFGFYFRGHRETLKGPRFFNLDLHFRCNYLA